MLSKLFEKYISQKNLYFLILFVITLFLTLKNIDIAIMIFVSVILACSLNPLVSKLTAKNMNRGLATTLVLFIFFFLILIFVLPILYLAVCQITEFAKEFPQYINEINSAVKHVPLLHAFGFTHINMESMANIFSTSSADIINSVVSFAEGISSALLYIFTAVILLFFFLVDRDKIKETTLKFFPSEYREQTDKILHNVAEKLSGYVVAQTLVSGSVWITMTIGLLIFKIDYAVLLGLIAGVMSLIPVVGSAISFIICLIATFQLGLKTILIVTALFTISHFVENNVVRPYVYSKFLNLHQIIVFLAIFIGAKYQGVLGVILAPPFAMALYILLNELYITKMDEETIK